MTQEVKNEIRMTLSFDLNLQKPGNFHPVSTILPSSLISISAPEFRGFDGQWSWGSALFLFSVGWPALLHSYLSGPYTHTHTHIPLPFVVAPVGDVVTFEIGIGGECLFMASNSVQLFLLFLQVFLWMRQGKDAAIKQFASAGVSFHGYLMG